jgi:DNA (cytosine-5)-methyltransferase 1
MNSPYLVLSLFPGLGLLDVAFESEGYTVVRGPDVLWGGDVRRFHPPAGVFAGVIGGPPCQPFSRLVHIVRANGYEPRHGNLIPEYERCVAEAQPDWFVMEEVPDAPVPVVMGYVVRPQVLNNRWVGGVQGRTRRLSFGTRDGRELKVDVVGLETSERSGTVVGDARHTPVRCGPGGKPKRVGPNGGVLPHSTGGERMTVSDMARLQGLPGGFLDECPFTVTAARQMLANGVPLPLGRAVAAAVRRAMEQTA